MQKTIIAWVAAAMFMATTLVAPSVGAQVQAVSPAVTLIEGVEAPALSVDVALAETYPLIKKSSGLLKVVTNALNKADLLVIPVEGTQSTEITKAQASLDSATGTLAGIESSLGGLSGDVEVATHTLDLLDVSSAVDSSAVGAANDAISAATDRLVDMEGSLSDLSSQLNGADQSLGLVSNVPTMDVLQLDAAHEAIGAATDGLIELEGSLAVLAGALNDAAGSVGSLSGSLILDTSELAAARASLATASSQLPDVDAILGEVTEEVAAARVATSKISGSVATVEDAQQYVEEITRARDAVDSSLANLLRVQEKTPELRSRLEGAIESVQRLISSGQWGNQARPRSDGSAAQQRVLAVEIAPPSLEDLLAPLYAAIDSVTDTQVSTGEAIPYHETLLDSLDATLVQAVNGVYTSLPTAVKNLAPTANSVLIIAYAYQDFVVAALFDAANTIDGLIGSVDALIPAGSGSCDYEDVDGVHVYYGTPYADQCSGSEGPDIFWTRNSQDIVYGYGNHDQIHLGNGPDYAYGGGGPDYIWGGSGDEFAYGNKGNDIFYDRSGGDRDEFHGGEGTDEVNIWDADFRDEFWGENGDDIRPVRGEDYDWERRQSLYPPGVYTQKDKISLGT